MNWVKGVPDSHCERSDALERQQRDLEIEIEGQNHKRHARYQSEEEQRAFQDELDRKIAMLNGTRIIYDLHRRKAHPSQDSRPKV